MGSPAPTTSVGLLAALTRPDSAAAWGRFVARYQPAVLEAARAAGLQPADADEVAGRVLLALVRAMPEFRYDPRKSFRGYLTVVVRNAVRSYLATLARRPGWQGGREVREAGVDSERLPAPLEDLTAELDDEVRRDLAAMDRVIAAARGLVREDHCWQAFWATAVDGEDPQAVAHRLGLSVTAVYQAKHRVGKLLAEVGRTAR